MKFINDVLEILGRSHNYYSKDPYPYITPLPGNVNEIFESNEKENKETTINLSPEVCYD